MAERTLPPPHPHFFYYLRSLKMPPIPGHTQPGALREVSGEHHRLRGYTELLHGHDTAEHAGPEVRQHRNPRVLLDHPYPAAVQAHPTLARAQDTHTHV